MLLSSIEASKRILAVSNDFSLGETRCELSNALNKVLKEDIVADRNYPPFNRVMMDGVSINFDHAQQKGFDNLKLSGIQRAGTAPLDCFDAVSVMTGAPVPNRADTVIPYEDINIEGERVSLRGDCKVFKEQFVHKEGSDILKGEFIVGKGAIVNCAKMGAFASVGACSLKVSKEVRISIVTTGDEVVSMSRVPKNFEIRDINSYSLVSELELFGLNHIKQFHLFDNRDEITVRLKEIINCSDVVILTGGVSKGKFDYIPSVLEQELEVKKIFHRVAQKPGKPLWFGIKEVEKKIIFGLPGNPVSSLVCLKKYVIPAIASFQGSLIREQRVKLHSDFKFNFDLTYFIPIRLDSNEEYGVSAIPLPNNNSGDFISLIGSDGFVELSGRNSFKKGDTVPLYEWGRSRR